MIAPENHKAELVSFFASQPLAVLATHNKGQPYGSLVAFAATQDLNYLIFSTTRSARKFANLSEDPRVAMVIDNRSNHPSDLRLARAVTATGRAEGIDRRRQIHQRWLDIYKQDCIPFAHGMRLFGQVYNDRVHPMIPSNL